MNTEVKIPSKEELLAVLEGDNKNEEHVENTEGESGTKFSERETQALSFGWKTKEKWVDEGGDPEDWRPARDFLERGEMIGKIRALTKETQETQRALKYTMEQNNKIYQTGYQNAITDLTAKRKEALAEGDLLKADEIGDQIVATKEKLETLKKEPEVPKSVQPDPEHVAWVEQNPWYNDKVMQKFADSLAIEYVQVNNGQVRPEDVRDYVTKTVRKEFAHRFEGKQVRAAPNPDGNGSRSTASKNDGGESSRLSKIEAEMPEEHRQIMRTMLKADPKFKKEDYLKMYNAAR